MRRNLHTLLLMSLAFLVVFVAAARAQDMRVDKIEIVESGFYDSTTATVTGTTPSTATVTGAVNELGDLKLLAPPPATSARVGIGFGVWFRPIGARDGERAMLRSVWQIPAPGIVNPTNGNTFHQSVSEFPVTIGGKHWRGYSFEEPWEVVPGTWTLEIWQGDRKLLEKSFEIK